jgi:hypothetical protein
MLAGLGFVVPIPLGLNSHLKVRAIAASLAVVVEEIHSICC